MDWVCVDRGGDAEEGVELYHHPVEDRLAFYYWTPEVYGEVSGAGAVYDGDQTEYFVWNNGAPKGFHEIPDGIGAEVIVVDFFSERYEANATKLHGGTLHRNWSMHESDPYPIWVVTAGGQDFYFHAAFKRDSRFFPYGVPSVYSVEGADYNLSISKDGYGPVWFEVQDRPLSYFNC